MVFSWFSSVPGIHGPKPVGPNGQWIPAPDLSRVFKIWKVSGFIFGMISFFFCFGACKRSDELDEKRKSLASRASFITRFHSSNNLYNYVRGYRKTFKTTPPKEHQSRDSWTKLDWRHCKMLESTADWTVPESLRIRRNSVQRTLPLSLRVT